MLITFSCKSHNNVTMFGDIAQSLITMMEFSTDIPGAISAVDVEKALINLEKNITVVKQQQISNQDVQQAIDSEEEEEDEKEVEISLSVRAIPLIDLLKTAISVESYVMWE
ncbi:DUF1840 domain-containing protein [Photobacterium phosphoreum]|uniref:DUF1840 domain-containing protein n=1 Tax=Photobacterium phosphoreum TaxID=659 RepID=UPI000D1653D3|nr:DUF1840 domain-containing protein [Photobacterium phosphoreum]PSW28767.1 DUF1840 domain-containing protein [Photobacterium phosphoreum]